jgi:hypothetical protein
MVLRNLRVSRLAEGDDARAPVHLMPPEPGEVALADPLTGPGVLYSLACEMGRGSTAFTTEGFLMKVAGRASTAAYWHHGTDALASVQSIVIASSFARSASVFRLEAVGTRDVDPPGAPL